MKWRIAGRKGKWDDATDEWVEDAGPVTRIETEDGKRVCGTCDGCNEITVEDASLIVAAPELLEALEAINECIWWSDTQEQWVLASRIRTYPALDKVRAAIAKARGE